VIDEVWDVVVVANGWSDNPVMLETEGLEARVKEKQRRRHQFRYEPCRYRRRLRSRCQVGITTQ